jgi:hypothetical protein
MTDDEKKEQRRERLVERSRVRAATIGAIVAAIFALALLLTLTCSENLLPAAILQPLLALALSVSLTLGARAVDGPIRLAGRRREAASASAAAAVLLLWLGCFSAIQAAFLVVDVVGRWNPVRTSCVADAKDRLHGTLTIADGAMKRTIAVTGCDIDKRDGGGALPSTQNEQLPADASAAVKTESGH